MLKLYNLFLQRESAFYRELCECNDPDMLALHAHLGYCDGIRSAAIEHPEVNDKASLVYHMGQACETMRTTLDELLDPFGKD